MTPCANENKSLLHRLPQQAGELVEEIPLAIAVNDLALSVMMVSPYDLEDFISGYFLTEGIIKSLVEIKDLVIKPATLGLSASVSLTGRREHMLRLRRFSPVSAGCGICNKTALEQAFPPVQGRADKLPLPEIDFAVLRNRVAEHQYLGRQAGALHAAACFSADGTVQVCREDIGRHNALDKVIGAVHKARLVPASGFLVITSRCGVELVQKAVAAEFATLVSFSSPTSFAVEYAHRANLNLIFLPRNNSPIIYHYEAHHGR